MKKHRYCYHITDGITRRALQCGTVIATSMEEAAESAARLAKLHKTVDPDGETCVWAEGANKRNVYILHDPVL